jgi:hypothetical protein
VALVRKPGGRCPSCGIAVGEHVRAVRDQEERIERIVAVIGTVLVGGVLALGSGIGLVEGVAAYAVAGAVMFYLARRTF